MMYSKNKETKSCQYITVYYVETALLIILRIIGLFTSLLLKLFSNVLYVLYFLLNICMNFVFVIIFSEHTYTY